MGVESEHWQVWQWKTHLDLAEHKILELQLLAGATVVGTRTFATSLVPGEWWSFQLKVTTGSGMVQCYLKIRGVDFLATPWANPAPSAPPMPGPEATQVPS